MALLNSIRTNPAGFAALRTLNRVSGDLDTVQNRVSTGLMVSGALDDASNFAIAQGVRSNIRAWSAVQQSLNGGLGVVNVAIAGAEAISDLLGEAKKKIVEYHSATGAQQQILLNDYNQILDQLDQMAAQARFNGVNLLESGDGPTVPGAGTPQTLTDPSHGGTLRSFALPDVEGTVSVTYTATASADDELFFGIGYSWAVVGFADGWVLDERLSPTGSGYPSGGGISFFHDPATNGGFQVGVVGDSSTVEYSFTFTPAAGAASDTGGLNALAAVDGSSITVEPAARNAEGLGLRPPVLSSAAASVAQVDAAMETIAGTLGYLGAKARQIIGAREQAGAMIDAYSEGLGNIVDADMAREAARLTSLQVQSDLSIQTLSLANRRPEALLGLF